LFEGVLVREALGAADGVLRGEVDGNILGLDDVSALGLPLGTSEGVEDGSLVGEAVDGAKDGNVLGSDDSGSLVGKGQVMPGTFGLPILHALGQ